VSFRPVHISKRAGSELGPLSYLIARRLPCQTSLADSSEPIHICNIPVHNKVAVAQLEQQAQAGARGAVADSQHEAGQGHVSRERRRLRRGPRRALGLTLHLQPSVQAAPTRVAPHASPSPPLHTGRGRARSRLSRHRRRAAGCHLRDRPGSGEYGALARASVLQLGLLARGRRTRTHVRPAGMSTRRPGPLMIDPACCLSPPLHMLSLLIAFQARDYETPAAPSPHRWSPTNHVHLTCVLAPYVTDLCVRVILTPDLWNNPTNSSGRLLRIRSRSSRVVT
jgi:hypothetical protein